MTTTLIEAKQAFNAAQTREKDAYLNLLDAMEGWDKASGELSKMQARTVLTMAEDAHELARLELKEARSAWTNLRAGLSVNGR